MPIGLLGALLGSALIGGGTAVAGALSRPRIPRGATQGIAYQNELLRDFGLPALKGYTMPALRRRSELEGALWPLIAARFKNALAPGEMSPEAQGLYRAMRSNLIQELADAKKRVAMDLAARGGIRSGAYPKRLENLERGAASNLAALYANLVNKRRDLALDLATRLLGAGPSPLTIPQVSRMTGDLNSQAVNLGELRRRRNSTLMDSIASALQPVMYSFLRS